MKKMLLAAVTVLTLATGSAFAAPSDATGYVGVQTQQTQTASSARLKAQYHAAMERSEAAGRMGDDGG